MKSKIHRSRKAVAIDNAIPMIICIVIVVIGIIAFTLYSNLKEKKKVSVVAEKKDNLYSHEMLLRYLNQKKENGVTSGQIISDSVSKKNMDDAIKDIQKYFDSAVADRFWKIIITDSSGLEIAAIYSTQNNPEAYSEVIAVDSSKVPDYNGNYVTVTLYFSFSRL